MGVLPTAAQLLSAAFLRTALNLLPGLVALLRRGRGWPLVAWAGVILGLFGGRLPPLPALLAWAILLLTAILLRRKPRAPKIK